MFLHVSPRIGALHVHQLKQCEVVVAADAGTDIADFVGFTTGD